MINLKIFLLKILAFNLNETYIELKGRSETTMPRDLVLIDFSLTVKATTLIFISGRSLAISSSKEGKSGSS